MVVESEWDGMVRLLLEKGADVDAKTDGETALHTASSERPQNNSGAAAERRGENWREEQWRRDSTAEGL